MNGDVVTILAAVAILAVWFLLMKVVLPRLGVPT
jgi:hypothetical protein